MIKRAENAKVAVFACGLEASSTETKGTVLIRTGEELMSYNKVPACVRPDRISLLLLLLSCVCTHLDRGRGSRHEFHLEMTASREMDGWRKLCMVLSHQGRTNICYGSHLDSGAEELLFGGIIGEAQIFDFSFASLTMPFTYLCSFLCRNVRGRRK